MIGYLKKAQNLKQIMLENQQLSKLEGSPGHNFYA